MIKEHDRIVLTSDLPRDGLKAGRGLQSAGCARLRIVASSWVLWYLERWQMRCISPRRFSSRRRSWV